MNTAEIPIPSTALGEGPKKLLHLLREEEEMDFTERLELYQEGGMINEDDVKDVLAIVAMFKEKYAIQLCEENADTFVAHLCAAFGRNTTHEEVEPLLREAFDEVKELKTYPQSVEMLESIKAVIRNSLNQTEQEYVLLHLNNLLDKLNLQS